MPNLPILRGKKYRAPTTNMAAWPLKIFPKRVGKVHHFSGANLLFVLGSVDFSIIFSPINFKNPNLILSSWGAQTMVGSHKVAVSSNLTLRVMPK